MELVIIFLLLLYGKYSDPPFISLNLHNNHLWKELSHSPRRKLREIECYFSWKPNQQEADLHLDPRYLRLHPAEGKKVKSSRVVLLKLRF